MKTTQIIELPVPIGWLEHYAFLLQQALDMKPPPDAAPEEKAACDKADQQITVRLAHVNAYIERLRTPPSQIN